MQPTQVLQTTSMLDWAHAPAEQVETVQIFTLWQSALHVLQGPQTSAAQVAPVVSLTQPVVSESVTGDPLQVPAAQA